MNRFLLPVLLIRFIVGTSCDLRFQDHLLTICMKTCVNSSLDLSDDNHTPVVLKSSNPQIADVKPHFINSSSLKSWPIQICGKMKLGFTTIKATDERNHTGRMQVIVYKLPILNILSSIIGWTYFIAWSVSYYPQIYKNYSRQSVVGLNFDFLALNIVGFILYSIYNCGMYFISSIQHEYFSQHPNGLNPVLFNDVFFSLHATFATSITISQCFCYEKGNQRISQIAWNIIFIYIIILSISGYQVFSKTMTWLGFLYQCSYIKLSVTCIKYIPQAFMNYRRKSTEGWSIGGVILDFIGGICTMLQMIINGYNYDDWGSIVGDPTKFGLGIVSVIFDLIFMFQHYILYKPNYEQHVDDDRQSINQSPSDYVAPSEIPDIDKMSFFRVTTVASNNGERIVEYEYDGGKICNRSPSSSSSATEGSTTNE